MLTIPEQIAKAAELAREIATATGCAAEIADRAGRAIVNYPASPCHGLTRDCADWKARAANFAALEAIKQWRAAQADRRAA